MEKKIIIKAPKKRGVPVLPAKFQHLNSFIEWSLETETERNIKRHESTMDEIRAFADVMVENVDMIVAHLESLDPETLPDEEKALMSMLLSLAEVAPAIEFYSQQAVVDGYDPRRLQANESFVMHPVL